MSATTLQVSQPTASSSDVSRTSAAGTSPSCMTSTTSVKLQPKPIQWSTSTGATVLQHLAATKEQHKSKNTHLTSNDLINSKPAAAAAKANAKKASAPSPSMSKGSKAGSASAQQKDMPTASVAVTASSSSSSSPLAKRQAAVGDDASSGDGKPNRRKKANRACSHCQKAHLVCADTRPCDRCVKKGLADSCTDGARKKAKYLLDEDELQELKREKARKLTTSTDADMSDSTPDASQSWNAPVNAMGDMAMNGNGLHPFAPHLNLADVSAAQQLQPAAMRPLDGEMYFSPASTATNGVKNTFDSENASLEYSILSSMLNGIDPSWLSGSPDQQAPDTTEMGSILNNGNTISFSHMGIESMPWQHYVAAAPSIFGNGGWKGTGSNASDNHAMAPPLHHLDAGLTTIDGGASAQVNTYDALEVPSPKQQALTQTGSTNALTRQRDGGPAADLTNTTTEQDALKHRAAAAAAAGLDHKPDAAWRERVKHIYGDKTKPFPYTEGYHFLIKYATANLDKAEVLRIVRALAIFRPSLIALQMPLTEDDEIFVERSIQRTSLEFEKLIAFSGTPTVVWRRTCEIVVVGSEFSMLTQWSKDYLMGRYIYEFFDKPSILEYWEKFALHAFENTAQSIMMPIALKTSAGTTTRCAACFSIKRDIFDLPSLIVGNFLPILS